MRRSIPLFRKLLLELQSNCNRNCFFCNREFDDSGTRFLGRYTHEETSSPSFTWPEDDTVEPFRPTATGSIAVRRAMSADCAAWSASVTMLPSSLRSATTLR